MISEKRAVSLFDATYFLAPAAAPLVLPSTMSATDPISNPSEPKSSMPLPSNIVLRNWLPATPCEDLADFDSGSETDDRSDDRHSLWPAPLSNAVESSGEDNSIDCNRDSFAPPWARWPAPPTPTPTPITAPAPAPAPRSPDCSPGGGVTSNEVSRTSPAK
jgi:hypothetical protein